MQTAADKCEEMEEGYAQCSQFLYGMAQNHDNSTVQLEFVGVTLKSSSLEPLDPFLLPIRRPGEDGRDEPWRCLRSVGL